MKTGRAPSETRAEMGKVNRKGFKINKQETPNTNHKTSRIQSELGRGVSHKQRSLGLLQGGQPWELEKEGPGCHAWVQTWVGLGITSRQVSWYSHCWHLVKGEQHPELCCDCCFRRTWGYRTLWDFDLDFFDVPRSELVGSRGCSVGSFEEPPSSFPESMHQMCIPSAVHKGPFSTPSLTFTCLPTSLSIYLAAIPSDHVWCVIS